MVKELDKILRKSNFQNDYKITQTKEKYESLRWYDWGALRIFIKSLING